MKTLPLLAGLMVAGPLLAQMADYPVISELRYYETSLVLEEFVELYNPTNFSVDMSGWKLQYKSSTGDSWLDKQTFAAGAQIGPHSFLLIGGTSTETTPDYPFTVAMGLGNSGGHVRIINGSQEEIDKVGWLAGDSPEGTGLDAHERGASFERKAFENSTLADMVAGGAHSLEGNAWDSGNNAADFVIHTLGNSNPQNSSSTPEPDEPLTDGSGTATCSVAQLYAPGPEDFDVTITGGEYLLPTIELELPAGWSTAEVNLSGDGFSGASLEQDGDTWRVTGSTVNTGVSGTFELTQVSFTTASGPYTIALRTAVEGGTPSIIGAPPVINVIGDPIEIAELHNNDTNGIPYLLGETVVVRGVVTASNQLGSASYMQDATGGIVCYDFAFSNAVSIGDDVTVLGVVTLYNGLVELTPATILSTNATGVNVEPELLGCADIENQGAAGEPWEGMLVRLSGITVEGSGTWAGNTNYSVSDATGSTTVRINASCGLVGAPIPAGEFDLVGVVGQYDFSAPHTSGYQLQPRLLSDQIQIAGPGLAAGPFESDHTTGSVTLSWQSQNPGGTIIVHGTLDGEILDSLALGNSTTTHEATLDGLDAGTPYWARIGAWNEDGASMAGTYWFSTVSAGSPGTIEVFFTQDVDPAYAFPGNEANGDHDVVSEIINLIDGATVSLDCAIYSLNIFEIAQAIIDAHDRGVAVRFIYDADHSQGEVAQIENAGVTVIDNHFGTHPGAGIQHNKFIVVDAADDDPANDRVWTGSLNLIDEPSSYGIWAKQNSVLIADQAVARAYTMEFNEMWGSTGMTPDPTEARYGAYKTNNTPKYFTVGGVPVEVLFSQGDNVSQRLVNYIDTAEESIYFCILVFTRNELNYAMNDAFDRGAAVRGVFDDEGDQYSEYPLMQAWGADIFTDAGTGILHHKYMIIDAEEPGSDPMVITGSYNWSNSAEYDNDENLVVIHDNLIANQYLQEFAQRYHDAGGTADFNGVDDPKAMPDRFELTGVYPNPFNPSTTVAFSLPAMGDVELAVYNLAGQRMEKQLVTGLNAGSHRVSLDMAGRPAGLYVLRVESAYGSAVEKMLLVK